MTKFMSPTYMMLTYDFRQINLQYENSFLSNYGIKLQYSINWIGFQKFILYCMKQ